MAKVKRLSQIFLLPVAILVIHIILIYLGSYDTYWWTDVIMHFTGGIIIGMSYVMVLKFLQKERRIPEMKGIEFFIFVISLVALTVVIWEFLEFSSDQIFNTRAQVDLIDTMQDMFLGLTGSIIGYAIKKRKN